MPKARVKYTLMPRTANGVSKAKAEEVKHYVRMTGHRAKVVKVGKDKYRVYTSSTPSKK